VAAKIHARHPNDHGRRDCSVKRVETKLAAILKHKRVPVGDREAYLTTIDRSHAAMCASEAWLIDGAQYAKSLENWLAPTMERYDSALAESTVSKPEIPRMVL
jgi:hypothetical protein